MNAIDMLSRISRLNVVQIAKDTLEANTDAIADLNAVQLAEGISADGRRTTLYGNDFYAPLTIQLKQEKSGLASVTDRITGFDTGSLYRNLFARLQGEQIEYGSTSPTAPLFEDQASNRIYGLTDENRADFIDTVLQPQFLAAIDSALGV